MLDQYAETLITHAVSLRPGQDIFIRGTEYQREFGLRLGEAAYRHGARSVHYHFPNIEELKQLIFHGSFEQISLYQRQVQAYLSEIDKRGAAFIALVHDFGLRPWIKEVRDAHPENFAHFIHVMSQADTTMHDYSRYNRFPHTAAPAANLGWAEKLFPQEPDPLNRLWQAIFHFALVDQSADALKERRERQMERVNALNALEITEIHISGNGNDLFLAISPKARWISTAAKTKTGQPYYLNFPSYEVCTVPDCRVTHGTLMASKPFRLFNLSQVRDLELIFQEGKVVEFDASQGKEAFGNWIDTDSGARFLGEIGLVGDDSPIYDTDLYFDLPNVDENAASHIALGNGISAAYADSERVSDSELPTLGCNRSSIHTDICFGSPDVLITAIKSNRGEVPLLEGGEWGLS